MSVTAGGPVSPQGHLWPSSTVNFGWFVVIESLKTFHIKIDWNCNFVGLLYYPLWLQLILAHSGQHFLLLKAIMHQKLLSVINAYDLDLWPEINRAHPQLMRSLDLKFHDYRWKGKEIMQRKWFLVIRALWPWLLTSKSIEHILNSIGFSVWSFVMKGVKGKQLCVITIFSSQCIISLWSWPVTFWLQNQYGTSSTHEESVCEVSWL